MFERLHQIICKSIYLATSFLLLTDILGTSWLSFAKRLVCSYCFPLRESSRQTIWPWPSNYKRVTATCQYWYPTIRFSSLVKVRGSVTDQFHKSMERSLDAASLFLGFESFVWLVWSNLSTVQPRLQAPQAIQLG